LLQNHLIAFQQETVPIIRVKHRKLASSMSKLLFDLKYLKLKILYKQLLLVRRKMLGLAALLLPPVCIAAGCSPLITWTTTLAESVMTQ
jgi:hypothetical protein